MKTINVVLWTIALLCAGAGFLVLQDPAPRTTEQRLTDLETSYTLLLREVRAWPVEPCKPPERIAPAKPNEGRE